MVAAPESAEEEKAPRKDRVNEGEKYPVGTRVKLVGGQIVKGLSEGDVAAGVVVAKTEVDGHARLILALESGSRVSVGPRQVRIVE